MNYFELKARRVALARVIKGAVDAYSEAQDRAWKAHGFVSAEADTAIMAAAQVMKKTIRAAKSRP